MRQHHDESQESFETRVFDAVRSEVNYYCEAARRRWSKAAIERRQPHVHVTVRTVRQVTNIHDSVQIQALQTIATDLPGAMLEPIRYDVRPHAGPPDIDIAVKPPAAFLCSDPTDDNEAEPPLRLLLAYGDRAWRFPLSSMVEWVPVGRAIEGWTRGGGAFVQVPRHVRVVPRDSLLLIRYWQGEVWWRRSPVRSRYTISVDQRVLAIGDEIPSRSDGTIEYVGPTGARTVLTYQFTYDPAGP